MIILKPYITALIVATFSLGGLSCSDSNNVKVSTATSDHVTEKVDDILSEVNEEFILKDTVSVTDFEIPNGSVFYDSAQGDLNGDGILDFVLMIKGTDSTNVVINRFDDKVDRNRRGVLIYLSNNEDYFLATRNLSCFFSENEDGGVYFPPELSMSVRDNKLYFDYAHGRYGFWQYTFRYQDSDFALIGYDASHNYGPIVRREVSINFLTKKRLTRENINQDDEESGNEQFEDTWEDIDLQELHKLSEIKDFEELDVH